MALLFLVVAGGYSVALISLALLLRTVVKDDAEVVSLEEIAPELCSKD